MQNTDGAILTFTTIDGCKISDIDGRRISEDISPHHQDVCPNPSVHSNSQIITGDGEIVFDCISNWTVFLMPVISIVIRMEEATANYRHFKLLSKPEAFSLLIFAHIHYWVRSAAFKEVGGLTELKLAPPLRTVPNISGYWAVFFE